MVCALPRLPASAGEQTGLVSEAPDAAAGVPRKPKTWDLWIP